MLGRECRLEEQAEDVVLPNHGLSAGHQIGMDSKRFALYHNFVFDMSSLIQALILFLIAFPRIEFPGARK